MNSPEVVVMMQRGLWVLVITSAPVVIVTTIVGFSVAVFQAATQLQDQTISQSLKLGAVVVTLAFAGGWMGSQIFGFADALFRSIPTIGR
jgi:type III secretion protein S